MRVRRSMAWLPGAVVVDDADTIAVAVVFPGYIEIQLRQHITRQRKPLPELAFAGTFGLPLELPAPPGTRNTSR